MPALDEVLHGSTIAITRCGAKGSAYRADYDSRISRHLCDRRGNRIEAFNLFFRRQNP